MDSEYDLICVGSGIGGCAAAAAAADAGARALVVERAEVVGGVTAVSGGQIWVPGNRWARALGMSDTAEEGARYIDAVARGHNDPARTRALLGAADEARDLFTGQGLDLRVIRGLPDYYHPEAAHSAVEGRVQVGFPTGELEEAGEPRYRTHWAVHPHETIVNASGAVRRRELLSRDQRGAAPVRRGVAAAAPTGRPGSSSTTTSRNGARCRQHAGCILHSFGCDATR